MEEAVIKRIMPHSEEAEQSVVGSMLMDKDAILVASEIITGEDFYAKQYGIVFDACVELYNEGKPVDLITLQDRLREKDVPPEVSRLEFVRELLTSVPTSANVKYYAEIVREKSMLRRLIKVTDEISNTCYAGKEKLEDILETTEKKVFDLVSKGDTGEFVPIRQVVINALDRIEAASKTKGNVTGVATGFIDLDYRTAGLQPSDLILIAARPSMGKTAFVLSMAKNMAVDYNTPVAIFSLEMSNLQLVNRLISNVCEIEGEKIKSGRLSRQEWEQLNSRVRSLFSAPLYVDDSPSLSILELRTKARRLVKEHGVKIIIIDYLQLMNATGMKFGSREQEVSMISRSLKQLAKELNIPVIALSQLSRKVEERNDGNKRPQLSDLRESGAIEQDADIVCFIHRPEYYTRSTTDAENRDIRGMAEFIVAKHRSGSVDDIEMTFVARFARFQNRSEPMPFEKGTMASKINDDPGPQEVYIPAPADGQPNAVDASAMGLGNDAQGGPMPDFLSE